MSKKEITFLVLLGVSGFIIGWLVSAVCGLKYFMMSFLVPVLPALTFFLFMWCFFTYKTVQDVLTYGLILLLELGIGASSANFVNPVPQEICSESQQ